MTSMEIVNLEMAVFGRLLKHSIFRPCVVYVDMWEVISDNTSRVFSFQLDMASLDLRMYGAEVVNSYGDHVTHVICDDPILPGRLEIWKEKLKLRKFHLLSSSWVTDSITSECLLGEVQYEI